MQESNPDLESFRQQWRAEVSARSKASSSRALPKGILTQKPSRKQPGPSRVTPQSLPNGEERSEEGLFNVSAFQDSIGGTRESATDDAGNVVNKGKSREPRSALENYERAVERKAQGNLGDSLNLYRKVFRLDSRVDHKYKNQYFPPSHNCSKPSNPNPSNTPVTVPNTAHHSLDGPPQPIKELIAGFSELKIEPAAPEVEGASVQPCPIATLPPEILTYILMELAILDVASFARLAQVCKRLAYVIATEEQIWKRVCLGSEVGFGAMHYKWKCEINGSMLEESFEGVPDEPGINDKIQVPSIPGPLISTESLLEHVYSYSWRGMFCMRPRIRFNGCYISTVNYFRQGQASPSQITWNSPVLAVTYYRYLRFFRDGIVISLQTTSEPADVVHYLTKDLQESHKHGQGAHLPSSMMQNAIRGRWRLSNTLDNPEADLNDVEGDVIVETEGIGKYFFRMELSLRSAGKGARNNKLAWKGYWHINKLSDDWAEFTLRNDRAFFWSRVKSYGNGA